MTEETLILLRDLADPAVHSDGHYCMFCGASVNKRSVAKNLPSTRHGETCPAQRAKSIIIEMTTLLKRLHDPYWKTVESCATCGHPAAWHFEKTGPCLVCTQNCKCDRYITAQVERGRRLNGYYEPDAPAD